MTKYDRFFVRMLSNDYDKTHNFFFLLLFFLHTENG